jgi:DMSO/TMAO reductase YedYZ heme-binding membrane subunit
MWFVIQGLIVFAVVASNIHWHWTPNTYLASMIGFIAALVVTGMFNELRTWQHKRAERRASQKRI